MRAVTTIQMTSEEDREINSLKKKLGLPSKKAVVLEGIRTLKQSLQGEQRRLRLQEVSLRVRKTSQKINREWAPYSTAVKAR